MKKLILIILVLICMLFVIKKNNDIILYSWDMDYINEENYSNINKIIDALNINILYQDFSSEYLSNTNNTFLEQMKKKNVDVYHLAGDSSWGFKNGYKDIIEEINKIVFYNNNVSNKIKGIVLDIEPYASEKFEDTSFSLEEFKIYVEQIKKSCSLAKEHNLEFILVIPYWFDKIDKDLFEQLISYVDEISVMNYNIHKTFQNISFENEISKKYRKKINTIYEINFGKDNYFSNWNQIKKDYKNLKKEYGKIGIAYHHYGSIKIND